MLLGLLYGDQFVSILCFTTQRCSRIRCTIVNHSVRSFTVLVKEPLISAVLQIWEAVDVTVLIDTRSVLTDMAAANH